MPNDPKTTRGRATRERIIERAADLIAERGVDATSLDVVRAASGASKSQLYHYFSDRDDLVAAAVEYRCGQVLDELTRLLGRVVSLDELTGALDGFIGVYEQTAAGCPIGTLASEVADRNEGARRQVAAAFDAWERLFADAIARMVERGELRADADPATLATGLLASLEGGLLLGHARRDPASLRVAVTAGLTLLRSYSI
ncbi:transcriptional regulator, TetR family [Nocardia amikacinitolerans]|uniref:TetR/AcrR family transcriptional regulator n=1 Tax=Nocardia amikacinitolerans TaxID=756689 RepID=UPI00082FE9B8|nr:TetR/AcrR family transcriptional regulator [Nocardia amikacinitolerans]MCP2317739.1 transcriptional regulator, TetR family [Nocardia amikacinitolerans]